ncbi:MAG TPA: sugar-transfer associated ATP-grasp domain-containing protein [Alphaproteobacteria bacterium]|nr:sugar-transfer associated ATP-grasp domain-containing protein [Alphaproteobacteria bacterium]
MQQASDAPAVTGDQTIETARPRQKTELIDLLRRLREESGRPIGAVFLDYAKTALGPGKLNLDEFIALGLYDAERFADVDIRSFVGLRAMRKIWQRANYRLEFYDLIRNKISMTALLEAHGFPAIPILAHFCTTAGYESATCLHSVEALRKFLTDASHYPLFGKPSNGFQSLGSASFQRYDEAAKELVSPDGGTKPLDLYVRDIASNYADGYLFQPRILPHPDTRALCGDRLSTVRVMTIWSGNRPLILRACEKIPGGGNVADNFWRPGNLLVQLDPTTGRRGRAISGAGFDMSEHTHHPDTGEAITGSSVPNWKAVCDVALEAVRLFPDCPLIGWDIAPVEDGAVIVEVNITPDLMLPQLADRKGLLDKTFRIFLEDRRRSMRARIREVREEEDAQYRPSYKS